MYFACVIGWFMVFFGGSDGDINVVFVNVWYKGDGLAKFCIEFVISIFG